MSDPIPSSARSALREAAETAANAKARFDDLYSRGEWMATPLAACQSDSARAELRRLCTPATILALLLLAERGVTRDEASADA